MSIKLEEIELIQKAKQGDKQAFNIIVRNWANKLFNSAIRLCGNVQTAEDIIQETFIKAYKNINSLNDEKLFNIWIRRILINTWKNYVRYEKRRKIFKHFSIYEIIENEEKEIQIQDNDPSPLETAQKSLEAEEVQKVLNNISEINREILIMRDMDNLSYEEISKTLNISIGTVKSRIARARQAVKQELKKLIGENHAM